MALGQPLSPHRPKSVLSNKGYHRPPTNENCPPSPRPSSVVLAPWLSQQSPDEACPPPPGPSDAAVAASWLDETQSPTPPQTPDRTTEPDVPPDKAAVSDQHRRAVSRHGPSPLGRNGDGTELWWSFTDDDPYLADESASTPKSRRPSVRPSSGTPRRKSGRSNLRFQVAERLRCRSTPHRLPEPQQELGMLASLSLQPSTPNHPSRRPPSPPRDLSTPSAADPSGGEVVDQNLIRLSRRWRLWPLHTPGFDVIGYFRSFLDSFMECLRQPPPEFTVLIKPMQQLTVLEIYPRDHPEWEACRLAFDVRNGRREGFHEELRLAPIEVRPHGSCPGMEKNWIAFFAVKKCPQPPTTAKMDARDEQPTMDTHDGRDEVVDNTREVPSRKSGSIPREDHDGDVTMHHLSLNHDQMGPPPSPNNTPPNESLDETPPEVSPFRPDFTALNAMSQPLPPRSALPHHPAPSPPPCPRPRKRSCTEESRVAQDMGAPTEIQEMDFLLAVPLEGGVQTNTSRDWACMRIDVGKEERKRVVYDCVGKESDWKVMRGLMKAGGVVKCTCFYGEGEGRAV